jgi:rubrerythrin
MEYKVMTSKGFTPEASAAALAVLEEAMRNEVDGQRFYVQAAAKSVSSRSQATFTTLAADEAEHLRILQKEYESLKGSGKWVAATKVIGSQERRAEPLFPQDEKAAERTAQAIKSDLEALEFAMGIEERAFKLYTKASQETDDPHARAIYKYLTNQENGHYKLIQRAHQYLTSPGEWYEEEEKPIFDGG